MKIKLLLTAIFLAGIQNFHAQETNVVVVDSVKTAAVNLERQKADEKAIKEQLKADNQRKDAEKKLEREQRKVERQLDKLAKEQRQFEKEQSKLASAEKSVSKYKNRLSDANKDLAKMQEKQRKRIDKGKLTPVEIEEGNVRITKQQLKIKEIEEDIEKSQKKLDKLR